ncbi:MAG: hypothetical protein KDB03_20435 [Planctomycetales bacterium]|nr:hypothetical protein [Planctomycetales bacterium]
MHFVSKLIIAVVIVLLSIASGWWLLNARSSSQDSSIGGAAATTSMPDADLQVARLNSQARKNLNLTSQQARPVDYWRTISIPGEVKDRPGISDRGVTSPAVGVISEIHVYPGNIVRPGERLVTLRLFSEYLQATQTQLFRATQEIQLVQNQLDRLGDAALSGAVSGARMIEYRNELQRQQTLIRASRQELLNRGLGVSQIDAVATGELVSTIEIVAPPISDVTAKLPVESSALIQEVSFANPSPSTYEVHSLAAELGQTVQAGEVIANLSNHQYLYVVGHAFKREAGWLEQAAQNGWPIDIEFAEDDAEQWPTVQQDFKIRHLSNTVDLESRTFDVFIPLANQAKTYDRSGETFLVWRFRPGQRTRLRVPVELLPNVFVLPSDAVVKDGPEAFVYRQNGDLFQQISVHILYEERLRTIIANDGSITPGAFLAQNAAASIRRVLKSQAASGEQPGVHVHADGSVHAAH